MRLNAWRDSRKPTRWQRNQCSSQGSRCTYRSVYAPKALQRDAEVSLGRNKRAARTNSDNGNNDGGGLRRGIDARGPENPATTRPTKSHANHNAILGLDWETAPRPPKGVNMSGFKKRLMAPSANDQLPKLDALIIVEGFNDCFAVMRAVRAPVFVLGGGYALADKMKEELGYLRTLALQGLLPRQLVVFTDPDWQGRMFRTYLDDLLPLPPPQTDVASEGVLKPAVKRATPATGGQQVDGGDTSASGTAPAAASNGKRLVVRHAFLRMELGTSEESTRHHEAGNVGVEHASPHTIRDCLRRARPGYSTARKEFSVEELREAQLIGSWDDKAQVDGPKLRRIRFCRALGVDEVGSGKALVNLLNRFFTREEYEAALQAAAGQQ